LWITNYKDTSSGPYKEFKICVNVAKKRNFQQIGVEYNNEIGSLLYPFFGKLSETSRFFVEKILTSNKESKTLGNQKWTTTSSKALNNEQYFQFEFKNQETSINGKIEIDQSWFSFVKSGWNVLRTMGLTGLLDFRRMNHVRLHQVDNEKWQTLYSNYTTMRIYETKKTDSIQFTGSIGEYLKSIEFQSKVVLELPNLQYAMKTQNHKDEEFLQEKAKINNI
jgi:hypothetical protein